MSIREQYRAQYADYLRENLKTPSDWKVELLGNFPGTTAMYQKYFGQILSQNTNKQKVEAINEHYHLHKYENIDKKVEIIDGKPRSIENFFTKKTTPFDDKLKFMALIFESEIKSLEDFVEWKHAQKPLKSKNNEKNETIQHNNSANSIKIERKKEAFSVKITKQLAIAVSVLVFFSIIAFLVSKIQPANAENKELEKIGNKTLQSSFFPKYINKDLFEKNIPVKKNNNKTIVKEEILYHTVNIFNDKCIHKQGAWSFETDANGEDMNSPYGAPFNENIAGMYPILKGRTTIANEMMDLHFNIENNYNSDLYCSSLTIEIIDTYDTKAENAKYNLYTTRSSEEIKFELLLDGKNTYGFTVNKEKVDAGGGVLFCKMRIKGSEKCENLIYRFKIKVSMVDSKGNHFSVNSDKTYLIAFTKL